MILSSAFWNKALQSTNAGLWHITCYRYCPGFKNHKTLHANSLHSTCRATAVLLAEKCQLNSEDSEKKAKNIWHDTFVLWFVGPNSFHSSSLPFLAWRTHLKNKPNNHCIFMIDYCVSGGKIKELSVQQIGLVRCQTCRTNAGVQLGKTVRERQAGRNNLSLPSVDRMKQMLVWAPLQKNEDIRSPPLWKMGGRI